MKYWNIVPSAQRKLSLGWRNAYSVGLCFLLSYYVPFGGSFSYFAPIVSVLWFSLTFGENLERTWISVYAGFIGASLGTLIGYMRQYPWIQLILLFLTLTWIHHLTVWNRMAKVLATIAILFAGVISPKNGEFGGTAFSTVFFCFSVPFFLTLFTNLFPIPILASQEAVVIIVRICENLKHIASYSMTSFYDSEFMDAHFSKVEHFIQETEQCLESLDTSYRFTLNESAFIPSPNLSDHIKKIITVFKALLIELRGTNFMLHKIPRNFTQKHYAESTKSSIHQFSQELSFILDLIRDYFKYIAVRSSFKRRCAFLFYSTFDRKNIPREAPRTYNEWCDPNEHVEGSKLSIDRVNVDTANTNIDMDMDFEAKVSREFDRMVARLTISKSKILHDVVKFRSEFITPLNHEHFTSNRSRRNTEEKMADLSRVDDPKLSIIDRIRTENDKLSFHNLTIRSSYFARLLLIQSIVCSNEMRELFTATSPRISYWNWLYTQIDEVCKYLVGTAPVRIIKFAARGIRLRHWDAAKFDLLPDWTELRSYAYPLKIAFAVTVPSALVIFPVIPKYNFVWSAITVAAVSNLPSSASTMQIATQRLEGTMLAGFFVYLVQSFASCPVGPNCNEFVFMIVDIAWVLVVACFREGLTHGYAAVVACFTPILLTSGSTFADSSSSFDRIVMVFTGIIWFVIIDLSILPNRTEDIIRANLISTVDIIVESLENAFASVQLILKYIENVDVSEGATNTACADEALHETLDCDDDNASTMFPYDTATAAATTTEKEEEKEEENKSNSCVVDFGTNSGNIESSSNDLLKHMEACSLVASDAVDVAVHVRDSRSRHATVDGVDLNAVHFEISESQYENARLTLISIDRLTKGMIAILRYGVYEPEFFVE